jgi:hypothetical protein
MGVGIFGCDETNLEWQQTNTRIATAKLWKQFNNAMFSTSSSIDVGPSDYQPGSTLTAITGKWTGHVTE